MSGSISKAKVHSSLGVILSAVLFSIVMMVNSGCETVEECGGLRNCSCKERSTLLVIGEDMSKSFHQHKGITDSELRQICEMLLRENGGGRVVFFTIGSPKVHAFAACDLDPAPKETANASMTEKLRCRKKKDDVVVANQARVDAFLRECAALKQSSNSSYTDINGFLAQAKKIFDSKGSDHHKMLLYINSDGKNEPGPGGIKPVDCSLMLSGKTVLSGWEVPNACGVPANNNLLAPTDFIRFWGSYIK
jgi:hypothetical protein